MIGAVYGARRGDGPFARDPPARGPVDPGPGRGRRPPGWRGSRARLRRRGGGSSSSSSSRPTWPPRSTATRTLLEGREREVTVLFADIRGFSALSERLSARLTCELIREIMEHLTARIMESAGVVVDYIGDGLLAMWNAPVEQPDHAVRACRAALAMRDGLPELNRRWEGRLGRASRTWGSASTRGRPWWATRAATRSSSTAHSDIRSTWPAASRGRPSTWGSDC